MDLYQIYETIALFHKGLTNLAFHWRKTYKVEDWRREFIWTMIYFSVAVWVSLVLTQTPMDSLEEFAGLLWEASGVTGCQ